MTPQRVEKDFGDECYLVEKKKFCRCLTYDFMLRILTGTRFFQSAHIWHEEQYNF